VYFPKRKRVIIRRKPGSSLSNLNARPQGQLLGLYSVQHYSSPNTLPTQHSGPVY